MVRWTVRNAGVGVTDADRWYDRIYWSSDETLSKPSRLVRMVT